MKKLFGK